MRVFLRVIFIEPPADRAPDRGTAAASRRCSSASFHRRGGGQGATPVPEPVGFQQDLPGAVVRFQDPPAPIQLKETGPSVVEQGGERRAQSSGLGYRVPDACELAQVGRETLKGPDLIVPPASALGGVPQRQDDRAPVQPVQPHVKAMLRSVGASKFVVYDGGLLFPGRIQIGPVGHVSVPDSVESGNRFIPPEIVAKIQLLEVIPTFAAHEETTQIDLGAWRTHIHVGKAMAIRPDHFVDRSRRRDPPVIRQRSFVQQRQRALERILRGHAPYSRNTSFRRLPIGQASAACGVRIGIRNPGGPCERRRQSPTYHPNSGASFDLSTSRSSPASPRRREKPEGGAGDDEADDCAVEQDRRGVRRGGVVDQPPDPVKSATEGRPGRPVAARTARRIASATMSAASAPTRARPASSSCVPVARPNRVSPSLGVWAG